MKATPKMIVLWLAFIALPVATGCFALEQIPQGVHQVPLHWDFSGNVDNWGSPAQILPLGFIMAATNVLIAVCYLFTEPMMKAGMVHGVRSPQTARKILVATAVFIVILNAIIYWVTISNVLGAL